MAYRSCPGPRFGYVTPLRPIRDMLGVCAHWFLLTLHGSERDPGHMARNTAFWKAALSSTGTVCVREREAEIVQVAVEVRWKISGIDVQGCPPWMCPGHEQGRGRCPELRAISFICWHDLFLNCVEESMI